MHAAAHLKGLQLAVCACSDPRLRHLSVAEMRCPVTPRAPIGPVLFITPAANIRRRAWASLATTLAASTRAGAGVVANEAHGTHVL